MSYYGPASQGSARRTRPTNISRLLQYDYSKHREHNKESMYRAGHFNRHNKRLRRTFRIVPWRDETELQLVGKALLSVLEPKNEITNQVKYNQQGSPPSTTTALSPEEAFGMISIWKSRLNTLEGLPHAVESTAVLAQVYWRDSQRRTHRLRGPSSNGASVSVMELRLAYSAAIVRCINGFADSLQQQRAMAASVANLCGQLGIPSWLVDTRHESSHNALPNLEVLRMSASMLLEFMRSEYWVPRCTEWNNSSAQVPTTSTGANRRRAMPGEIENLSAEKKNFSSENTTTNDRSPVDFLLEYKACASDWGNNRVVCTNDNEEKGDKTTPTSITKKSSKRKKKSSSGPKKTIILPYDPLFGEIGTLSSSSDDDDSFGADDNCKEENKFDKPAINSIWGSSVGTSTNRYILLDIPKQKKGKIKDKKKHKKSVPNNIKKRKGEKSPTDCAKLFVQSVSSLQEGYSVAVQYLIWGGVGGALLGRGVLITGSEDAFPATPLGITKSWQLYSPLIHVISRTWPGFSAYMITHLVDCVVSIEDSSLLYEKDTNRCIRRQDLGEGPTRKVFFLSAWIRLLLSHRFVAALDQGLSVKTISSKNNNPLELPLAQLDHLECLGYPLNSILDRCCRFNSHSQTSNGVSYPGLTETSRAIIHSIEIILGENKINDFGYPKPTLSQQDIQQKTSPSLSKRAQEKKDGKIPKAEAGIASGAMSLDEMEKLLLLDDNGDGHTQETKSEPIASDCSGNFKQPPIELLDTEPPIRRPAWVRCKRWDACAIGTLPGYPF